MSDVPNPIDAGSGPSGAAAPNEVSTAVQAAQESGLAEPGASATDQQITDAMTAMSTEEIAELLGDADEPASVSPGTELTGTVTGFADDEVFLQFGVKSQGVMPRAQFDESDPAEIGHEVQVVVDRAEADTGLLFVRRKGAVQRAHWDTLAVGALVEGRVTGMLRGGLEVDLQGIRAFMPSSQVSLAPMKDISILLNEKVRCEVVEANRRGKNVVVSRRKLLERERAAACEQLKAELEVGQVRKGIVRNLASFGAFVDLGGLEGLVHIRDLSWSTVDKVSDVLTPGQEVEVSVLKIDLARNRISLGLKQALPDPWAQVPQRYDVGTQLKARIVRSVNFGAFAELEPGVEALVPLSEMTWQRATKTSDVVSVGDIVDAVIIRLEADKRRIALSMRQAQPDPWEGTAERFPPRSLVTGHVTRLADFGAFVELLPGVEGLIHISELSQQRIKTCRDVLTVGQVIEIRVLGVDIDARRISLSLKQVQAPADPDPNAESQSAPEVAKPAPKRKRPRRGGLSSHFEW